MDGLLIGVGFVSLAFAISALFRPQSMVRESLRNRDRRLEELNNGAPEAYFEERRALEAYPPRFDPSIRTIRLWGSFGSVAGLVSIFSGIAK